MSNYGHNETAVRLSILVDNAKSALDRVANGETTAVDGWMEYGAAMNEGRALHKSDKLFGKWIQENQLDQLLMRNSYTGNLAGVAVEDHERKAAMWAAANAEQFEEALAAGNARTVRGIHAQWKKIEAERAAEKHRKEEHRREKTRREDAEAVAAEAKAEAERQAEIEAEAKAVAAATSNEAEKVAAEKHAEIAAEAKAEAEAVIEAEPVDEPEPDDPEAADRELFRSMTAEGQEDDWLGLRAENAEMRVKIDEQRRELADAKARIKE